MFKTILAALVPCSLGIGLLAAGDMENSFLNPPDSARPGVYWYFMNGNLNGKEMTADLESMKAAGLGNLVFLEVDIGEPPGGPVAFMSQQPADANVRTVECPPGFLGGQTIKAGRYTFSTHGPYNAQSQLVPSGLLGPVRISNTPS